MKDRFARIVRVERTGSTNEDAAARLGDDASLGTTIVAGEQTHGKGRRGRTWVAPAGSALLFTTILPREVAAASLWAVAFWTALAVRAALERNGIRANLHWPNDLLLGERKLAGILCISRIIGARARIACGVGINVVRFPGADAQIAPPPAFCDDEAPLERETLLAQILKAFALDLDALDDPAGIARRWERAAELPQRYRLLVDGESAPFEATAIALAPGGALVVERDGVRRDVQLADARALR